MIDKDTVVVPREAQDRRRTALIERLGTVADLACSTPLPGELGDVAYDLLRQAAAQIASDRLHIRRLLAAAPSTSVREEELADALVGIHQARLHNGRDEGWGWDIGLLNRAMDVALPLIGQPRPERMSHEERTALRARFDALLDADRATPTDLPPLQDTGERDG